MTFRTPRPPKPRPSTNWPTPEQLEKMGMVRCATPGCATYRDPVNTRGEHCQAHQREERAHRRQQRFQHRPRMHDQRQAA